MASLDFLFGLEGALVGGYGGQSNDVTERIIAANKEKYQAAIDKGQIKEAEYETKIRNSEGDLYEEKVAKDTGIDWSKLPTPGPQGFQVPENYAWKPYGGDSGFEYQGGETYNDPNYGPMELTQMRAPDDPIMSIGKTLILASVLGPASVGLAGLLAPALGISGSLGTSVLSTLFKSLPGLAMGGNFDNLIGGVIGNVVGGTTGIPLLGSASNNAYQLIAKKG